MGTFEALGEKGVHVRLGPTARAVLALLLFSGSILGGLAPPASAQGLPLLCFEKESPWEDVPQPPPADCDPRDTKPADYLQGDVIRLRVENLDQTNPYVRIKCVENCHEVDGRRYYARWSSNGLRFPQDFNNDRGPHDDGSFALQDRVPRYNSTWEARLLLSQDDEASTNPVRHFNVWLMSVYASENLTVKPGEHHRIRSTGLERDTPYELRIERRISASKFETVLLERGNVPNDGIFRGDWDVPKDETRRMAACGTRTEDCYRLSFSSPGKTNETITFRVGPAVLQITDVITTGNAGNPTPRERTQSALLVMSIHYPGAAFRAGPKLEPTDIPLSSTNPGRGLRVVIEKYNLTSPDEKPIYFNETFMHFAPLRFAWEVDWSIPRDLPLDGGADRYRLRLLDQRDAYDNRVPGRVLGNFSIERATLAPIVVEEPAYAPRTELVRHVYQFRYHNGSVWGPAENQTGLRGCFVRENTPARVNCRQDEIVYAQHENGTWVFSTRYARDYANVYERGAHRLFILDGFEDPWGNTVDALPDDGNRAHVSGVFTVIAGSPRVEFGTVQRGREALTFERGYEVAVQAIIQYADGKAFNSSVLANNSRTLNVTLTRRGPDGAVQREEPLVLRETDPRLGRWIGSLPLTRDDTQAPLGRWTFTFDLKDNLTVPNANLTGFDRDVAAALFYIDPAFQPSVSMPIGATAKFRFSLHFEDGRVVPPVSVGDRLSAYVYAYDRLTGKPVGEPVSGLLQPSVVPGTDEFLFEYPIPGRLFAGEYIIVPTASDFYGNRLADGETSRSWRTYAETRQRSVLVQPPVSVKRGEAATVVFDGQEGDVGAPPLGVADMGVPAIRLERWDIETGKWVIERLTQRISEPSTFDHVGVAEVTTTTIIGTYRFRLEGRDSTLNNIHSVSENFTIEPTIVPRTIVETPAESVTKGETIQFAIERRNGDRIVSADILFNGRPITFQKPALTSQGDHINVTYVVPYEAQTGNYSVRVTGRDLYGNAIEVYSPQTDVAAAALLGKIIGNPVRIVERGEAATIVFGITNPDGGFYLSPDEPLVEVHNGTAVVGTADVGRDGLTFTASWTPEHDREESEYVFVVSGTGVGGNSFPTLRSQPFRVAPGVLTREPSAEPGVENLRIGTVTLQVAFEPDDVEAQFSLGYFGPSYDVAPALFETRDPTTITPLPHTIDVQTGRYVARFVTDHTTPLGAYRILMTAKDAHGNEILSKSRVFLLQPTTIIINWEAAPPDETFGEGKTYERGFIARYRDGTVMTSEHGTPSAALLYDNFVVGPKPVAQRPTIEYRQDRWIVTWTGPEIMPDGSYTFSIGGSDVAGNGIATSTTNGIVLNRAVDESVGLFLKEVPSVSPILVLVLLVAVALGRRRS